MKRLTWTRARAKVDSEGRCRSCARSGCKLDAAHIIGRRHDNGEVNPDRIVPLCGLCHRRYDAGDLGLEGKLTVVELAVAALDAGSEASARRRIIGSTAYREEIS